jgi:hypothetical protein
MIATPPFIVASFTFLALPSSCSDQIIVSISFLAGEADFQTLFILVES